MRGVVQLGIVLSCALIVIGVGVMSVNRVQNAARMAECRNNLKSLGVGVHSYADSFGHFPTGTLPNDELPPAKRLSWLIDVYPSFMMGGVTTNGCIDRTKAWDAPGNCPVRCHVRIFIDDKFGMREHVMGEVKGFLCPANAARTPGPVLSPTHYLGVAGVGQDAAELPLDAPRVGFFGYDRKISPPDVKDGLATTLMMAEAMDGGPWTAGGEATVRGLSLDRPYLGEGGSFSALHHSTKIFSSYPLATNVMFADASVRPLTAAISPQVLEALATIAGGEQVAGIDAE